MQNPGSKGLPSITMTGNGPSARIRVEYVRRQVSSASGLFYTVEFGPAPNGPWEASLQPGTPTPIDGIWERVAVESNRDGQLASETFCQGQGHRTLI